MSAMHSYTHILRVGYPSMRNVIWIVQWRSVWFLSNFRRLGSSSLRTLDLKVSNGNYVIPNKSNQVENVEANFKQIWVSLPWGLLIWPEKVDAQIIYNTVKHSWAFIDAWYLYETPYIHANLNTHSLQNTSSQKYEYHYKNIEIMKSGTWKKVRSTLEVGVYNGNARSFTYTSISGIKFCTSD